MFGSVLQVFRMKLGLLAPLMMPCASTSGLALWQPTHHEVYVALPLATLPTCALAAPAHADSASAQKTARTKPRWKRFTGSESCAACGRDASGSVAIRRTRDHTNPRFGVAKRGRFGKTYGKSTAATPNQ